MRYVKPGTHILLLAILAAVLAGCASSGQDWNYDGSQSVSLVSTEGFLPVQQRDENGQVVPYEAELNPYTQLSGRIDKVAVTAYINARRAFQASKYDVADQLLAELSGVEPKLSGPWVMRGDVAVAREDLPLAVEHYAQAVEVNPINFNAYLRLAKVQRQLGHFHHAQNTYARALALWADGPELHLNLGVLYDVYLNMPVKAQAHMEAYQLLKAAGDEKKADEVAAWLSEIRRRTGLASALKILGPDGEVELAQSRESVETGKAQTPPVKSLIASKSVGE